MLKGIVFDLDGTLWHTGGSYLYAYRKLCEVYGVTDPLPDDVIRNCLGVKIDQVLLQLFPSVPDQPELTRQALHFAVEYLLANPESCCFPGVQALLRQLSETYDIYIVSNCLHAYADTFVSISGTGAYITGIYTIEDGEKSENLNKVAAAVGGKLLFVGDSDDDYNAITDRYSQYFCYARYGYKPCSRYDYAISAPLELLEVTAAITTKERQLQGKRYRVISRGENRVTLIQTPDDTDYFGFTEYADEDFSQVVDELKSLCRGQLIGPINGNTYYPYRYAVDSYDWQLYPDCGGEQELPCFLSKGFQIHQEYLSVLARIDHRMWKLAKRAKLPPDYRVEMLSGEAVYTRLKEIYQVAVEAFSSAYLYEPISCRDFTDIYVQGLQGITPDLVMIYHSDTPIALCFCYEDPERRFYVCKTVAVKKGERNSAVILTLIDRAYQMMTTRGHTQVLHHFKNLKWKTSFSAFTHTFVRQKKFALLEYRK